MSIKLIRTKSNAIFPQIYRNFGYLFYPCFGSDYIAVRPGQSTEIDFGFSLENDGDLDSDLFMSFYESPYEPDNDGTCSLIIHHEAIFTGPIKVRVTNPSQRVCIIAKDSFDLDAVRGYGIFRTAFAISAGNALAMGIFQRADASKCLFQDNIIKEVTNC